MIRRTSRHAFVCLAIVIFSGLIGLWPLTPLADAAVRLDDHYHDIDWDIFIRSVEVIAVSDPGAAREGATDTPDLWVAAVHLSINQYSYIRDDSWTTWQYHLATVSGGKIPPLTDTSLVLPAGVPADPGAGSQQQTVYFALPSWPIPLGTLMIDTQTSPLPRPLRLPIPYNKVRVIRSEPPKRVPSDGDLQIVRPVDGDMVTPGETIPFDVTWPDELGPPTRIMIITPTRTFQDYEANGHYMIRIEPTAQLKPYPVIALLVWGEDLDQSPTLSQSVSLQVVTPAERWRAQQISGILSPAAL